MKVFIDLFSGLGGASVAFDRSPDWCVLKFDNNPILVEHNRGLHLLDLSDLDTSLHTIRFMLHEINERYCGIHKLVIWASPPCNEFSFANANRPERPSTVLIENAFEIIQQLDPDFWVIENVHGAKETFTEILDRSVTQEIGPIVLWGHFPLIPIRTRDTWKHRKLEAKGSRVLRPNNRALIPEPVSEGLFDAIEHQQTLFDY